jgi:allantoin racemase
MKEVVHASLLHTIEQILYEITMTTPRLLLIQAFDLPENSAYKHRTYEGGKESELMNFSAVEPLLADVEWELARGPLATYGDWPVESREEFCNVSAGRLPIVREACESGKYDAIVLLGGGDPGFHESREIAQRHKIPVTACAHSQMTFASTLGNRFSVIEMCENMAMFYRDLVRLHGFSDRCASIRNINFWLPRPGRDNPVDIRQEKAKVEDNQTSAMLEAALVEAVAAIEEDGAEVITLGCSCTFWMRPYLQRRLYEMGWDVPVLDGYSCAIALAKTLLTLGQSASGLTYPGDRPKKVRRRILL